jgi:hypothetical protein
MLLHTGFAGDLDRSFAGSVSRDHDNCDNQQCCDQRKRAIEFFRSMRSGGSVDRGHDSSSLNPFASGPAPFGQDHPVTVGDVPKQAGLFERVGALRTGRHLTRFLKRVDRACIPAAAVRRGFLLHGHTLFVGFAGSEIWLFEWPSNFSILRSCCQSSTS